MIDYFFLHIDEFFFYYLLIYLIKSRLKLLMPFFNRTRLERVGVVGSDLDCCWADRQTLTLLSSVKTRKKKGRRGLRL